MVKKLLLRANCPTNDYWDVDFIHVELTDKNLTALALRRNACLAFLTSQSDRPDGQPPYWGHVELPDSLDFTVGVLTEAQREAVGDLLDQESALELSAEQSPLFVDAIETAGTELHSLLFYGDGTVCFKALAREGSDVAEAELPGKLLPALPMDKLRNTLRLCVDRLSEYPDAEGGTALELGRRALHDL